MPPAHMSSSPAVCSLDIWALPRSSQGRAASAACFLDQAGVSLSGSIPTLQNLPAVDLYGLARPNTVASRILPI